MHLPFSTSMKGLVLVQDIKVSWRQLQLSHACIGGSNLSQQR